MVSVDFKRHVYLRAACIAYSCMKALRARVYAHVLRVVFPNKALRYFYYCSYYSDPFYLLDKAYYETDRSFNYNMSLV